MAASKGKKSEKKFNDECKKFAKKKKFNMLPLADAHVCRGRIPKQPGDNVLFVCGQSYITDVKELEKGHNLAAGRISQLPQMRLLEMSGVVGCFFVHQLEEKRWYPVLAAGLTIGKSTSLQGYGSFKTVKEAILWLVGSDFLKN